jgi:DNA topoisomerase-1
VVEVIKLVAKKLGNTPAICRKCYVHPSIISSYLDGKLVSILPKLINKNEAKLKEGENPSADSTIIELSVEEKAILEFLQKIKHSAVKAQTS